MWYGRGGGIELALRHLFPKKVNLNQCKGVKEHYGKHKCKHLDWYYCTLRNISLKHSDKKADCELYEEQEDNEYIGYKQL